MQLEKPYDSRSYFSIGTLIITSSTRQFGLSGSIRLSRYTVAAAKSEGMRRKIIAHH
jgi:hypothetical protein